MIVAPVRRPPRPVKAIGMMSGGLDSTLAAAVLQRQGIEVLGINFYTGFCVTEQHRRLGVPGRDGKACRNEALRAGADLEFEVRLVDIAEEYYGMIANPKYGYGSAANPCIDCRIFMLRKVSRILEEEKADFVFTGEVVGQRPMSQRRPVMDLIEKQCGLEGRLLRPLSAKLLPMTVPEQDGRVDREGLLGFWGRSRKPQMALAAELGIRDYPQPAGGCCFLADLNYARKFFDLVSHRPGKRISHDDVVLLGVGRHFRFPDGSKVIVGRNAHENRVIEDYVGTEHWLLKTVDLMGPVALVEGEAGYETLSKAACLAARYVDRPNGEELVRFHCTRGDLSQDIQGAPMTPAQIDGFRIPAEATEPIPG